MKSALRTLFYSLCLMLLVGFLVLVSEPARAQDARGLTEQQKAIIEKQIAEMRVQNNSPTSKTEETIDTVRAWSTLGKDIGAGLAGAAKELGVAANEFATTPVGKLTAAIIVWKLMGASIVKAIAGFLLLFVVMPLWVRFWMMRIDMESREGPSFPMSLIRPVRTTYTTRKSDFQMGFSAIGALICTVVSIVLLVNV